MRLTLAIACIALIHGDAGVAATAPVGKNLIQNSGFEHPLPNGGWLGVWDIDLNVAGRGRIAVTPKYRKTGIFSLRLAANSRNVIDSTNYDYGLIQRLPLNELRGKPLLFQGWINAEHGATAIIRLVAVAEDGSTVVRAVRKESDSVPTRKPVLKQDVFDVPDFPLKELFLMCSVQGTVGAAYFDDVYVGAAEISALAAGRPDPGHPLDAFVHVRYHADVRQIPSTLYGTNIEYAHSFYGVWNEFTGSLNPNIVDLTKDLGVTSLRFPGGLFANFYHWKNGIGPYDSRPESLLLPNGGDSINSFGTDEAIQFAKSVNAPLFITANAYSGTPSEAAEWVQYVKEKGHADTIWEIGNEIYFINNPEDPAGLFWTPERYASTFRDFAAAMRAADPDVRLAADVEFNFTMAGCGQIGPTGCWADVILRDLADQIDYIAIHNALAPIMLGHDAGWDVRTVYAAMLAAPIQVRKLLDDLSRRIDDLAGPYAPGIRLAMVEWGPLFQTDPKSRFIDHVKTLSSALYTASLLKVLIEHPRVEIAHAFSLFDPWTQGWIGLRGDGYAPKAPYYALQLFTRHFGTTLVESETRSPKYDVRSMGLVPATEDVPYLDVVASRHDPTGELRVIAINKHFDRPIRTVFEVWGFSAFNEATAWTLSGTSPDANTGTEFPSTVPEGIYVRQSEVEPNGRFYLGGPDEVTVKSQTIPVSGSCFEYEFPAHSVTALVIPGARLAEASKTSGCGANN